jgi:hypothetical protein
LYPLFLQPAGGALIEIVFCLLRQQPKYNLKMIKS